MHKNRIYFISGACASGKTSIIEPLKEALHEFIICDFDAVGVPNHPTKEWREKTTRRLINAYFVQTNEKYEQIIIGLTIPQEVKKLLPQRYWKNVIYILLDVSPEEQHKRLQKRGEKREYILNDKEEKVFRFRNFLAESGFSYFIIDTTTLTSQEVAERTIDIILQCSRKDN